MKLANGEYTAASVSADQLGAVKEKDGNYGTKSVGVAASAPAASQASSGVQSALFSLTIGGS